MPMPRLVLWDIDGTLVHGGDSGVRGVTAAYRAITGLDPTVPIVFDGQTDLGILRSLAERGGLAWDEAMVARVPAAISEAIGALAADLATGGYALPGAAAAIDLVAGHAVAQSVLTGNVRANAELKLRTFGLHRAGDGAIDFDIGAYGGDAELRPDLVPVAIARASSKHSVAYAVEHVVLVGDTPRDVHAALAHGARVIAVATGRFSAGALRAEGAHVVLDDLTDLAAFRAALDATH
jgi:phosphoglycolate phosphatase-like HAD superfamily hydrolase